MCWKGRESIPTAVIGRRFSAFGSKARLGAAKLMVARKPMKAIARAEMFQPLRDYE